MSRHPCKAAQRIAFDKRQGRTPSEAQLYVVRHACPCDRCAELRAPRRLQPARAEAPEPSAP